MAEHWLKRLGSTLLDTGAAYLQQVRLVQELKALPLDQARERFSNYVSGLSAAARAGFALTLTHLIPMPLTVNDPDQQLPSVPR